MTTTKFDKLDDTFNITPTEVAVEEEPTEVVGITPEQKPDRLKDDIEKY